MTQKEFIATAYLYLILTRTPKDDRPLMHWDDQIRGLSCIRWEELTKAYYAVIYEQLEK